MHKKVIVDDDPATPPVSVTGHAEDVRVENPQCVVRQPFAPAQFRPFARVRVVKVILEEGEQNVQHSAGREAEPGGKTV